MKKTLIVAALALLGADLASANLLTNGGFESQSINPGDPYRYVNTVTGWDTYSGWRGIILFNGGYLPVSEGVNAVQLEAPGDTLSQTFATTVGQTYHLSYDLDAYSDRFGGTYTGDVQVTVNGQSRVSSGTSAGWQTFGLDFTATGASTTLSFESLGIYFEAYPQLDNISVNAVTAVPEPATAALMLAGLAAMGAVRRRRG